MKTLQNYFDSKNVSPDLQKLIFSLLWAGADFYELTLFHYDFKNFYADTTNKSGDRQLKIDVAANDVFVGLLKENDVALIASEELAEPIKGKSGGKYAVAFDPLDGSSIVDADMSVGSIVGIYEGNSVIGRKGDEQVAALAFVYGPQFTFFLTVGQGTISGVYRPEKYPYDIVAEQRNEQFYISNEQVVLAEDGKYFAPGNLRAASNEAWYMKTLQKWIKGGYTLRYSGGMVPDIGHIFVKGGGIFLYPGTEQKPDGKLRLLYECAPFAFLIEQAGGKALTQKGERILDILVEFPHQTTTVFLGSKNDVEKTIAQIRA
jgi:fructose-1,6-bisphosphatase